MTALGKHWHVEHFACAKCEKAFLGNRHRLSILLSLSWATGTLYPSIYLSISILGNRHFEKNGLAFCATHYHQLFGSLCHHCDGVIEGDVFTALNKVSTIYPSPLSSTRYILYLQGGKLFLPPPN